MAPNVLTLITSLAAITATAFPICGKEDIPENYNLCRAYYKPAKGPAMILRFNRTWDDTPAALQFPWSSLYPAGRARTYLVDENGDIIKRDSVPENGDIIKRDSVPSNGTSSSSQDDENEKEVIEKGIGQLNNSKAESAGEWITAFMQRFMYCPFTCWLTWEWKQDLATQFNVIKANDGLKISPTYEPWYGYEQPAFGKRWVVDAEDLPSVGNTQEQDEAVSEEDLSTAVAEIKPHVMASALVQDKSMPQDDQSMAEQEKSIPEQEKSIPEHEKSTPEQDLSTPVSEVRKPVVPPPILGDYAPYDDIRETLQESGYPLGILDTDKLPAGLDPLTGETTDEFSSIKAEREYDELHDAIHWDLRLREPNRMPEKYQAYEDLMENLSGLGDLVLMPKGELHWLAQNNGHEEVELPGGPDDDNPVGSHESIMDWNPFEP